MPIIKEAFYFSHDSNSRNDEKIIRLRMKYKWEGYGLYWAIIERLREATNYMCIKDYNIIAFDLRVDASIIKSIIEDFGLFIFTDCGKYFYSKRLKASMDLKSQKASDSARKRWDSSERNANAMRTHTDRNAIKEKKRKEKKKEEVEEEKKQIDSSSPPPHSFNPPEHPPELIPGDILLTIKQARERYDSRQKAAKEALCIQHSLNGFEALEPLQNQFDRHLISTGVQHKTEGDYSKHFANWLNRKPPDQIKGQKNDLPSPLQVIKTEVTDPEELAFKLKYSQKQT